jgi:hypothetical protein
MGSYISDIVHFPRLKFHIVLEIVFPASSGEEEKGSSYSGGSVKRGTHWGPVTETLRKSTESKFPSRLETFICLRICIVTPKFIINMILIERETVKPMYALYKLVLVWVKYYFNIQRRAIFFGRTIIIWKLQVTQMTCFVLIVAHHQVWCQHVCHILWKVNQYIKCRNLQVFMWD